ncbi:hypothetical protein V1509DRAFT_638496 [Lipomyces kononenkoae]
MESGQFLHQQRRLVHDPYYYPQHQQHPQAHSHAQTYTNLESPPPYVEYAESSSANTARRTVSADQKGSDDDIQQEEQFLQSTLQWIPSPPSSPQTLGVRLKKPVVIPRMDVVGILKAPLPFLRAYSPVLHAHDIHETDFLAFIDNLAVAQAGSPVFQAINAASMAIGFVPHHWCKLAATGMQVAAGVGTAAVAIVRTKKFLETSNEKYFAPRGLKVSIKKDEEVASIVKFPPSQRMLSPVDLGMDGHINMCDRRMDALAPYIAPLTTQVPPPTKQRNILDKIAAKQVERTKNKKEERMRKKQYKAQAKQQSLERMRQNGYNLQSGNHEIYINDDSSSDSDSSMSSIDSEMAKLDREIEKINRKADAEILKKGPSKAAKIEYERSKDVAKVQCEKDKLERKLEKKLNKKMEKKNNKGREADLKMEKKVHKMEYIVIENLS